MSPFGIPNQLAIQRTHQGSQVRTERGLRVVINHVKEDSQRTGGGATHEINEVTRHLVNNDIDVIGIHDHQFRERYDCGFGSLRYAWLHATGGLQ